VCAVESYKDLGAVEQAFRCFKTVDLQVRPIHHRLEGRVRAQSFCVCSPTTLSGICVRLWRRCSLQKRARAADVVSPKKPSPNATRKARTKKTLDGAPVQPFQTLLADLSIYRPSFETRSIQILRVLRLGNKKRNPRLFSKGRLICSKTSRVASSGNLVFAFNPLLVGSRSFK
jgi:hypothetical protein